MLNSRFTAFIFLACCFLARAAEVRAQDRVTDSLKLIANKPQKDTASINALFALAQSGSSYDSCMTFIVRGRTIADELDDREWKGRCSYQSGNIALSYGYAKEAVDHYTDAIRLLSDGDSIKYWIAKSMNAMGNAQRRLGRLKEATDSYLGAKEIFEALGDRKGIAGAYNNLGIIFMAEDQPQKALEYYAIARRMNMEIGNKPWLAKNYSNMGTAYYNMRMYDSAEVYFKQGMSLSVEVGDQPGWALDMMNLGNVYTSQKNYAAAEEQFRQTLSFYRANGFEADMAMVMHNIAGLYTETKEYDKAKIYLDSAAEIGTRYEDFSTMLEIYKGYAAMYEGSGDYRNAYAYYTRYSDLRDSIMSTDMKNQMDQMEESLREERLKEQNEALVHGQQLKDVELNRSYIIIASAAGGLVLVLLLSFVLLKRYQLKKKANNLLTERNREIEKQKEIIEQKNRDISDSIRYAKKIQETLIPEVSDFFAAYRDAFILYLPRDVVSGDFYWYALNGTKSHIAVADCTGHGVPGAFMSMLGIDKIQHAIVESGVTHPAKALSAINRGLKVALRQGDDAEGMRDGMDIALIAIDRATKKLEYAGANRPVWIIRNGELIELLPSKVSLGGHTAGGYEFASHGFDLQEGDGVYLFTDGYADQFGGPKGKKMMTKRFKELLLKNAGLSMREQDEELLHAFLQWKGSLEQVDDVCVIGIRI